MNVMSEWHSIGGSIQRGLSPNSPKVREQQGVPVDALFVL